ncbi:MAG: TonB-dependent receptor [Xanthomonadales bacterium]|nr:TonB-dependent receptor [Xanthomonadales bacterium]
MRFRPGPVCQLGALCMLAMPWLAFAEDLPRPWQHKPVVAVLEYFRSQGLDLAYSDRLVPDGLLVLDEPGPGTPLAVLRQILLPHGLEVRHEDGIYFVIRSARGPPASGNGALLVVVRGPGKALFESPVAVSISPGFPAVEILGPGLSQTTGLKSGNYRVSVLADGFVSMHRNVRVYHGQTTSLTFQLEPAMVELEALSVSASRYLLFSNSQFFVDQRAIENLPGNGDDPLRATHRLPGAAAGGWSSQAHFRGGEENESAIFLNGLQLLDPFHVRDFHNVFSSINARSISGVEAYTGGFPATYGDRMSGILLLQSRTPEAPRHHELGISVFNTSLLTSGYDNRVDWLVSARRSNLAWVLDKTRHGEPDYHDVFATLGFAPSPASRITFNYLRARDSILAITEHLPDDREFSTSETRNQHFWLQYETAWANSLSMSLVASHGSFSNIRQATVADPEQLVGEVRDDRWIDVSSLRLDFSYELNDRNLFQWGIEGRDNKARYDYRAEAVYDGFYLAYPGVEESIARDIQTRPSGGSFAGWVSNRWQATPQLVIDAGLRWDKQSYIGDSNDDQVSPRLSFLYSTSGGTDLRLSWGRYYQSQSIQEMQVEDGVETFFPAQRSDHLIAGLSKRLGDRWSIRAELFSKQYSQLRPRFENLLDPVPLIGELEPDRVRIDPESANATGLELTAEYDRGDLNGWASWTVSRVTDTINGQRELRNWDQLHALHVGLAWYRGPWELGVALNMHSGWPTTPATLSVDDEGELELVYGPRNTDRLNTFINLDLRIARNWQLPNSRLSAFFELNNALDHKNTCCVDYDVEDEDLPSLERSVDHWLGVSPAIGLLWEF